MIRGLDFALASSYNPRRAVCSEFQGEEHVECLTMRKRYVRPRVTRRERLGSVTGEVITTVTVTDRPPVESGSIA